MAITKVVPAQLFIAVLTWKAQTADELLSALDGLSNTAGATADTGQFASCGQDTVVVIRKLMPRLKMVHIKDIDVAGAEVNVLLGKGLGRYRVREGRASGRRYADRSRVDQKEGLTRCAHQPFLLLLSVCPSPASDS